MLCELYANPTDPKRKSACHTRQTSEFDLQKSKTEGRVRWGGGGEGAMVTHVGHLSTYSKMGGRGRTIAGSSFQEKTSLFPCTCMVLHTCAHTDAHTNSQRN